MDFFSMFQTHPLTVFKKHELLCRWSKREALMEKSEFNDEGALSLSVCAHWCRETFFIFFFFLFLFFFFFCVMHRFARSAVERITLFIGHVILSACILPMKTRLVTGRRGMKLPIRSVTRLGDDRFLLT